MPRVPNHVPGVSTAGEEGAAPSAPITRVPNLAPEPVFEPLEHQVGQDHERVMKSTGPAREALQPAYFEGVDRPVDAEKLELMRFNEDELEVHVHLTNEKEAEAVFEVSVNGRSEFFRRGERKKCRRKFVEQMARAKITTYAQERRGTADGEMYDVQIPTTALRYPFSVLKDPHPRGADWLESVLAQP